MSKYMDAGDWIALLSFLGALLSAIYARWTFTEARRSNQIAIHKHQKEIFEAFTDFMVEFIQLEKVREETLFKLAVAVHTSDFYLSDSLSNKLKMLSELAYKLNFDYQRKNIYEKDNRKLPDGLLDGMFDNEDKCHELGKEIEEELRNVLRLEKL